ncbi:hypothetical protein [Bacillus sp. COPE52]|nr:hypothetical protein [Bacillus sp. COPE52]
MGLIGIFILVIGVASFSHNEVIDRYNPLRVKKEMLSFMRRVDLEKGHM